jgi:hypothetical protein
MLAVFGIASFFFPKFTILLGISYFINCEVYLLSDTVAKALGGECFGQLKFDRIIEFHLAALGLMFGLDQYNNNPKWSDKAERLRRFSRSF